MIKHTYIYALIVFLGIVMALSSLAGSSHKNVLATTYLNELVNKHHFAGVLVYIDTPAKKPWHHAYGYSNIESKKVLTIKDSFRIASATKTFVATLMIRLAQRDLVNLDVPLSEYLDDSIISGIQNADMVTIRQLLGMRSGIYNYTDNPKFADFVDAHPDHQWTANDALRLARHMPARFKPDSASEYSNTNYILLGLVIEKITQQSLAQAMSNYIFMPLNLQHSYVEQHSSHAVVPGYVYRNKIQENINEINDGRGLADGGVISTAKDMTVFMRHLMQDDSFIAEKWRKQMQTFHPMRSEDKVEYGLGLIRFTNPDFKIIGHDGSDSGYQSWMIFLPEENTSIIFLSNSNPPRLNQAEFIHTFKEIIKARTNSGLAVGSHN